MIDIIATEDHGISEVESDVQSPLLGVRPRWYVAAIMLQFFILAGLAIPKICAAENGTRICVPGFAYAQTDNFRGRYVSHVDLRTDVLRSSICILDRKDEFFALLKSAEEPHVERISRSKEFSGNQLFLKAQVDRYRVYKGDGEKIVWLQINSEPYFISETTAGKLSLEYTKLHSHRESAQAKPALFILSVDQSGSARVVDIKIQDGVQTQP